MQMSPLYSQFKEYKLLQNMRTDRDEINFSKYILQLGEGNEDVIRDISENTVKIPENYLVEAQDKLIEKVFPTLGVECADNKAFIEGTIYTPLNKSMKHINGICIS